MESDMPDFRMISENMRILKEEFGFDSLEVRTECLRLLGPPRNRMLLDVGTGSGWMSILAAQSGFRVVSVDLDADTLLRAEERARQAGLSLFSSAPQFLRADVTTLPLRDRSFDVVCSYEAMHHLSDFTCRRSISEMRRVLRPGGTLLIADLSEAGREAVRLVFERKKEDHFENRCSGVEIGTILGETFPKVSARELPFEMVYLARKAA
jgi:ubiquinone/menaquinone biosynthesis C-methylase UbiE